MKMLKVLSSGCRSRRVQSILLFFVSFVGTLLGAAYFFRDDIFTGIASVIINIGLDDARASFVVALLMTLAAAVVGGLLGRRKSGVMVAAGIVFWFRYLASFIQSELLPHLDGGGHLKPLNSQGLWNTSFIMMGLALSRDHPWSML